MRIARPLLKLPVRFCGDTLARQVSELPSNAWVEHPQKFDGNIAVPLVSPGGALTDSAYGQMGPTQWLSRSPYIIEIMQALESTWGRSRLMGLQPGAVVPEHVDVHYYWRTHLRLHIPIITNPDVAFTCAGETIHMQAGECWLLDSFYLHSVANRGTETRIHLVLDTVGSATLWDLIQAAASGVVEERFIAPGETRGGHVDFEQINAPVVMSPWEMKTHIAYLKDWTDEQPGRDDLLRVVDRFVMTWEGLWARYGISEDGLLIYLTHLNQAKRALATFAGPEVTTRNRLPLALVISGLVLDNAVAPGIRQRLDAQARQGSGFRLSA